MRKQIEACHAVDIRTPIYISAGFDEWAARLHPEWVERTPEGGIVGAGPLQAGWRKLCFNTPYVDYLEQQTTEVFDKFGDLAHGIFFDIISQSPCCCKWCLERMDREGLDPEDSMDRMSNANAVLKGFKQRMTACVRKHSATCDLFYNSGHVGPYIRQTLDNYTHLELESLPGLRDGWGYEHFPITVRFARNLGRDILGMTGKFQTTWGDFGGFKDQAALEYDCFGALAYGAKCSIGDQLHPSGAICPHTYDLIGSVYRQVAEKQPWCDDVTAVTELAVLTPESLDGVSHTGLSPAVRGAYRMLEELHYQFDIVDVENDYSQYKVLILPDELPISIALQTKIDAFVANGGRILATHKAGLAPDEQTFVLRALPVTPEGDSDFDPEYVVARENARMGMHSGPYCLYGRGLRVIPRDGATVLADLWQPYFNRTYRHFCSHHQTPYQGEAGYPETVVSEKAAYLAHPLFSMYHQYGARVFRHLVQNALVRLLPKRLVETNAPTTAHISLNRQADPDRYVLHILHYIPEGRSRLVETIEEAIPLYDVSLRVRLPHKPETVYLAPSREALEFDWSDGCARVQVPKVHGHAMVVFE